MEVFPVRIALQGREVWLGWVSAEQGNYLVQDGGAVVWSPTRAGLLDEMSRVGHRHLRQDDTLLDLDRAVAALAAGRPMDADALIDLWNILTDFHNTVAAQPVPLFSPEDVQTYNAVFANCGVADALELEPVPLSDPHRRAVLKVMEKGGELIASRTFGRH